MRGRHLFRLLGAVAEVAVVLAPGPGAVAADEGARTVRPVATQVSKEVYQGWKWYHVYCYRCHGTDATSNPGLPGPDLKTSVTSKLSEQDFILTVHDGRPAKGMPTWGPLLTNAQIEEIYQYVTARAAGQLKPGRPDEQ